MKSEAKSLKVHTNSVVENPSKGLTSENLKVLKAPFPRERLGVKVQSYSKDRSRAMLVLYLQHTDVQERLEEVDPAWTMEVLHEELLGSSFYVRLRLTLNGVSRENVGEGSDPKAAYSDALKRSAMLFGVGRYLYDSETVWVDYNEAQDRYRKWSIEEYEQALQLPPSESSSDSKNNLKIAEVKTKAEPKKAPRSREQLNRLLMNLYRPYLTRFPQTQFIELLNSRYGVGETRLMALEQLEDLVRFMEEQLRSVA